MTARDAARLTTPVTLVGTVAELVPLQAAHAPALAKAVEDGRLWTLWYTTIPAPSDMAREIERRLGLHADGRMLPFTVIDRARNTPVGMTTYMNIDAVHDRVEIGSTWLSASAQRTAINTECKRMLLAHAFETLGCIAVEFRTHALNTASRRAIERLGAKLDGMLRHHQRMPNGTLRDTAVYSIVAPEWPTVRAHLDGQLARPRG